jgi:carbon-monoxide dehydrogenase medium subunit
VIPAEFDYAAPSTLDEVLELLSHHGEDAKLLAGGHSLIPLMKLRLARPSMLIDLRKVTALKGVRQNGDRLHVGATTTHATVAANALLQQQVPALAQAARQIGDRQVRARGTIGGSLAHYDPAADMPAVMLALDAQMVLRSTRGERVIAAADFFRGMLETALAPDELLTEVRVKATPRSAYAKYPNPASHYAIAGVAAAIEGNGSVSGARVGVTGAAASAYRAAGAEAALAGRPLSAESIAAAAAAAHDGRELLSDIHASAEYRAALVGVLTRRALESISG